jgi:hypothetical protein
MVVLGGGGRFLMGEVTLYWPLEIDVGCQCRSLLMGNDHNNGQTLIRSRAPP